ncbi:MAG: hypothetical protein AABZ12_01825, partial [Planctomycetota bacterium]
DGTTIRNEWDFVRYGTLGDGEAVAASDPPQGVVDVNVRPGFDRFRVTFDRPGFVYVTDVAVEVLPGPTANAELGMRKDEGFAGDLTIPQSAFTIPVVSWVRRPEGGEPDTVEIVLDQPLPVGFTTRFTFNAGGTPNTVEYTVLSLGACCLADGSCMDSEETECASLPGSFTPGAACSAPQSCCVDGECIELDPLCCSAKGGMVPTLTCDLDADGDTLDAACGDGCPADPDKSSPGPCGCGVPDSDADGDTVPDCLDQCPGADDRPDADQDGIPDCLDFRPIPTTTAWGLVCLALLLLCAVKIACLRRNCFRTIS